MKDKRSVDDLSIEELERVLTIKKRETREARLRLYRSSGRAMNTDVQEYEDKDRRLPSSRKQRGSFGNFILTLVEVAAVAGLLYIGFDFWQERNKLNAEAKEVLAVDRAPTAAPTPIITALVLPSGHTPPTAAGGARPNNAEIPDNLRPLVQALPAIVIPTPSPRQATRLVIPSINVDAPVVQGDGWEQLRRGVGQHVGTADPGRPGNTVFSAHNDIFGEIFRDLDRLKPGDEVVIHTASESFTYVITGTQIVKPTAVHVMDPTTAPTATLISCYPYMVDTERFVVFAELATS